jgi:hypothetical protein
MKLQKKSQKVSSSWEIIPVESLPPRKGGGGGRELSAETQELLDRLSALKFGQAIKIPDSYVTKREVNGSIIHMVPALNTVNRRFKKEGRVARTRTVNGTVWVFIQKYEEEKEEAA